jgi:hypothetical protein
VFYIEKKNSFGCGTKTAFCRMEEPRMKQILFTSTKNRKNKEAVVNDPITSQSQSSGTDGGKYYELLVLAAEGILEKGIVSLDELYMYEDGDIRCCDNRSCGSSGPKKHSMWNKVKQNRTAKQTWLCTDCFKAYKNGQFCYYCATIYRDDLHDYIHTWIQCDYCEQWHHLQCEESKGDYPNISKLIQDPGFKYMCLPCRSKKQPKKKGKEKLLGQKTKAPTDSNSKKREVDSTKGLALLSKNYLTTRS